MGEDNFQQI